MDNVGGDACLSVQRAEWAGWAPLCTSAVRGTHKIPADPLECGEVHRLPYGDPPVRPTRHQVLHDPTTDRLETIQLGGEGSHNAYVGYSATIISPSSRRGIPWSTGLRYIIAWCPG